MAVRKAGVITVDFVGQSGKLQADSNQASSKLGQVGVAGRVAGRQIAAGMAEGSVGVRRLGTDVESSGRVITRYATTALHGAEAIAALAATHVLAAGAIAKYAAGGAASVSTTNNLVNSYRVLRVVLSPTVFTAASLAAGVLVEETIRLVNARAKLIDQQALFAAANKIAFQSVDSLDTVSKVNGSSPGAARGLFTELQSQSSSNQGGVESALGKLGVSGSVADPAVLGKIARGFQSISDPVKQAELAMELFGEKGGEALQTLDGRFANSSEAVQKWGIAIDEISRSQIHQFRQDLINLRNELTDFSEMKAWWESFKTGTEIVAAAAEDMSKRGIHALDNLLSDYIPGVNTLRAALTTLTPGLAVLFGKYGAGSIPQAPPLPPPPGAAQDKAAKTIQLQDSLAQEEARRLRQRETLEGQRQLRDSKEAQSKQAFQEAQNPKLSLDDRALKAQEAQSSGMVSAAAARHVKEMEDAEQAARDAEKAAEAIERILHQRFASLAGELQESAEKLLETGRPKSDQQNLRANFDANKAVATTRGQIEEQGGTLSAANAQKIRNIELGKAAIEAETSWRSELATTTQEIKRRIEVQTLLNSALGKGYEQTKRASVEAELMQKFGQDYSNPKRQGDISRVRSGLSSEYDARHEGEVKQQLADLRDRTELEKALMAVQREGAEAVRQAELAYRLDQIAKSNDAESTKKLQAAEKELYAATQANHSAATVAKIADETAALKRLTAAAVEGAEAVRKAGAANQFADLAKKGGAPVPGMIGVSQEQIASAGQEQALHEKEITDTAFRRVNVYKDQLSSLNQQLSVLKEYEAKNGDNLNIDIAIRDIENEKLNLLAQQYLATGKLSDGMKAFFLESAANAKKPGQILHDGLDHAVDGVSEELSKAMTGQKADWGRMLQGLGQGMLKDSLKSGMQQGLGALGKSLHIPGLGSLGPKKDPRPLGVTGDPFHVWVDNQAGDGASMKSFVDHSAPVPTIASTILGYAAPVAGGVAGGLAGGGGGSRESVTSSISYGGARAAGGPVSPDTAYWVGEHGPEPFVPRTAGSIIPAGKLGGGGAPQYNIIVNAPNSDIGAAGRIKQMLAANRTASVSLANQVAQEHAERMPR